MEKGKINWIDKKGIVVLNEEDNIKDSISNNIDEWFSDHLPRNNVQWFHIHKFNDIVYINAEGYNTPPLSSLVIDIDSLNGEDKKNVGKIVFECMQKKLGYDEPTEYLTLGEWDVYDKEENKDKEVARRKEYDTIKEKEQIEEERNEAKEKQYQVNTGNTIVNILKSLNENGNCKVYLYPEFFNERNSQPVMEFYIGEDGRLNVKNSVYFYDFKPYHKDSNHNYSFDFDNLVNPSEIDDVNGQNVKNNNLKTSIVSLFINQLYYGGIVSTYKPYDKIDTTLATNEFNYYISEMFSVFKNESQENWLENNGLFAQWVKTDLNGRMNIVYANTDDFDPSSNLISYDSMVGNLVTSVQDFSKKLYPVENEWKKIQNGEYNIEADTTVKKH